MTIQHHFVCGAPRCRTHVHVTIVCHDGQELDVDKLGAAVGFRETPVGATAFAVNRWRCQEHHSS